MTRIDPHDYRRVLSHLPTGVTVITAQGRNGPIGMTANSVTSVSLDPPLILFCPAKSSTTWPGIRAAGNWCVNILAGHHEELTRRFALKGADRFVAVPHSPRSGGPGLDEAVAWIDCGLQDEHDAGDHTIVVAEVLGLEAISNLDPLIFFRGTYGTFSA